LNSDVEGRLLGYGLRPETVRQYLRCLGWLEETVGLGLDEWGRGDLDSLMAFFQSPIPRKFWKRGDVPELYSPATVKQYLAALKTYYRVYEDQRVNWVVRAPRSRGKKPKPVIEDVEGFLDEVWNSPNTHTNPYIDWRNKFMLWFAYFFACRRSELPIIRLSDVDNNKLYAKVEDLKGGGGTYVEPMSSPLFWSKFDEYKDIRGRQGVYLFGSSCREDGRKISKSTVSRAFRGFDFLLERYGIRDVNCTPHLLRRTRATVVAGRLNTKQAMYVTRHKSVGSFQRYVDLGLSDKMRGEMMDSGALEV